MKKRRKVVFLIYLLLLLHSLRAVYAEKMAPNFTLTDIDGTEFSLSDSNLSVLPFDSENVTITFSPVDSSVFNDSIVILSNDKDTTIYIDAVSIETPEMSFSKDTIEVTITSCNDTIIDSLVIYNSNTTTNDLEWTKESELIFDGNDYVSSSSANLPSGNNPISVETWFKTTQSGAGYFAMSGSKASKQGYHLLINHPATGKLFSGYWGTGFDVGVSGMNDGQWHHFVGTYDGSIHRAYVDGVPYNTQTERHIYVQSIFKYDKC